MHAPPISHRNLLFTLFRYSKYTQKMFIKIDEAGTTSSNFIDLYDQIYKHLFIRLIKIETI